MAYLLTRRGAIPFCNTLLLHGQLLLHRLRNRATIW